MRHSSPEAFNPKAVERDAAAVAGVLAALANRRRLAILCKLVEQGEASVNALAGEVGLSQSALSQHLHKMRSEGIVAYRRDGRTLWYRIADARIERLLGVLHDLHIQKSHSINLIRTEQVP